MTYIKIPPYPNLGITDESFNRDIIPNSEPRHNSETLSSQLVMIVKLKNGVNKVIRARPVKYQNKLFVTAFPNPVHLFLSVAVEHYNKSENVKERNFLKCGKKYSDDVYLLDFEENGTHDCYNHYLKYRMSSIIMLVSSLEAFLNQVIPNDFIYKTTRKEKDIEINKNNIESSKVSFSEKLLQVIPQYLKFNDFWETRLIDKERILELYKNRKNVIHLKTNAEDDFERYFLVIDQMLDFEISNSINSVINFMNSVSKNFVEYV